MVPFISNLAEQDPDKDKKDSTTGATSPALAPIAGLGFELGGYGGIGFSASAASAAIATSAASSAAAATTASVTLQGSGLVFKNTYGTGVTSAFISDIVDAEHYFQSICTNTCTLNMSFGVGAVPAGDAAVNSFSPVYSVKYSTLVNDLESHATSAEAQAAVTKLLARTDFITKQSFVVPIGMAQILGIASADSTVDDSVTLSSTQAWSANSNISDGSDVIGTLEHEISEGALGRIGGLGIAQLAFQTKAWGPMDLFRYNASGKVDINPKDGAATYFSADGSGINASTSLQFHNGWVNNAFDGGDFADWDQVGPDINAIDAFGPSGGGFPTSLSATDREIMEALGWTPQSELSVDAGLTLAQSKISEGGSDAVNFVLRNNGAGTSLGSKVGIYLSTDSTITSSDTLIGVASADSVDYGQANTESGSFKLPSNIGPGTYYIGVIADYNKALQDANRANNVSTAVALTVTLPTFTWAVGTSGDWYSAGWNQPQVNEFYVPPGAGDIADITAAGVNGPYTVLARDETITTTNHGTVAYDTWETGSLLLGADATLEIDSTKFYLDSSVTSSGDIKIDTTLTIGPSSNLAGATVFLDSGSAGTGTITLSDSSQIVGADSTVTLENIGETIRGGGTISGLTFYNFSGTVNATSATATFAINSVGQINNYGLLEDTGAAGLSLSGTIEQQRFYGLAGPGKIEANGANAKVYLNAGAKIVGGTVTTANGGVVETVSGGVTFDGSAASAVTGIANSGLFKIVDGSSLTVIGNLSNSGTIEVTSPYYGTALYIDSAGAFFSGAGKIQLDAASRLLGTSTTSAADLENSSNIVGAGSLGIGDGSLTLTNRGAGIVDSTAGLTINTDKNVLHNSGLLEATTGALTIASNTVSQTGGTIFANGSNVVLANVDVTGGTIMAATGSAVQTSGSVMYDGVAAQVQLAGTTEIVDGSSLTLKGPINNTGEILLDSPYYGTNLYIDRGGATLTGKGSVRMLGGRIDHAAASIFSTVYNVDNLIYGVGSIGSDDDKLGLINEGRILSYLTGTLTLSTGDTITNSGVIEGDSTGGLSIGSSAIENISKYGTGSLKADNKSFISLNSATIHGGSLNVAGSGFFQTTDTGSVLDGSGGESIAVNGKVAIGDGTGLTLAGAIVNKSSFALTGSYYGAHISVAKAGVALTGGGAITMTGGANSILGGAGYKLTNVDNVISGGGSIGDGTNGVKFINDAAGVVNASDASTQIGISTSSQSVVNTGLIEATGAAGLQVIASTIDQTTGGKLYAADGSKIDLSAATLLGGTLQSAGTGYFDVVSSPTLDGVTLAGTVKVTDGNAVALVHTIVNNGEFALSGSYYGAQIVTDGATLTGGGSISMVGGANSFTGATGVTLTNVDNTIAGDGSIGNGVNGIKFINNAAGIVKATSAANQLVINTSSQSVVNTGLIEAIGAAGLQVLSSTIDQTTGGRLYAGVGSKIDLNAATILGGTLQSAGTGYFDVSSATLDGVKLAGTVKATDGNSIVLADMITNNGVFALSGSYYGARLVTNGAKLVGGGFVTMTGGVNAIIGATGVSLTNVDNTISGGGSIGDGSNGVKFVNDAAGVVNGTDATTQLVFNTFSESVVNSGLIEATGAAGVEILNSTINQLSGGKILARTGSKVDLNGAAILGGTLQGAGSGFFEALDTGSVLASATVSALVEIGDSKALFASSIVNSGTFSVNGSSYGAKLSIAGSWSGGGRISLGDFAGNTLALTGNWTNVDNIVSGAGSITGPGTAILTNKGTIEATYAANALNIGTGHSVVNNGLLEAAAGTLNVADAVTGAGSVLIKSGGVANFEVAFGENVSFQGAKAGELELAKAYAGHISGFAAGDTIDLTAIGYGASDEAVWRPSTSILDIIDTANASKVVAKLNLSGESLSGELVGLSSDGDAGTTISLTPEDFVTVAPGDIVYSNVPNKAYSAYEKLYHAGAFVGTDYFYTNVSNQPYSSYAAEYDASGAKEQATYDLNNGGHRIAGYGDDLTFNSLGNDTMTGGGGGEHFLFNAIYGHDVITDFAAHDKGAGHDVISLSKTEFADFSALMAGAANSGANVVITAKDGDSLTLDGLSKTTLAALSADFTFHA